MWVISFCGHATCERGRRACPGMYGCKWLLFGVLRRALFPSLCVSSAKTQLPAECRWTSNVSGPHLSPLLSKDRRRYTLKQHDMKHTLAHAHTHIHTQYSPASDTAALVCFGNRQLKNFSPEKLVRKMLACLSSGYYLVAFTTAIVQIDKLPKSPQKMDFANKMREKNNIQFNMLPSTYTKSIYFKDALTRSNPCWCPSCGRLGASHCISLHIINNISGGDT